MITPILLRFERSARKKIQEAKEAIDSGFYDRDLRPKRMKVISTRQTTPEMDTIGHYFKFAGKFSRRDLESHLEYKPHSRNYIRGKK